MANYTNRYRRRLKDRLYADQDGCCKYCGKKIAREDATFDHVIPLALGGTWSVANLVVACRRCNQKKGNKHPAKWAASCIALARCGTPLSAAELAAYNGLRAAEMARAEARRSRSPQMELV